jgi:hypothetical protein
VEGSISHAFSPTWLRCKRVTTYLRKKIWWLILWQVDLKVNKIATLPKKIQKATEKDLIPCRFQMQERMLDVLDLSEDKAQVTASAMAEAVQAGNIKRVA